MVTIKEKRFKEIQKKLKDIKVAVIGDVMLDIYYWGNTERISPEAPVPIVNIVKEEVKPGGAANVAFNISSLGATSVMFGVIGNDLNGSSFIENLSSYGIHTENILVDKKRATTVKTRIVASNQHVVRFDRENTEDLSIALEKKAITLIKKIKDVDAVIFQDYNKGFLTNDLIVETIKEANSLNIPVGIDPKLKNMDSYKDAYLFKPNLIEAEAILKRRIITDDDLKKAGKELLSKLNLNKLVITLSERGMAIFSENKEMEIISAKSTKIANVSGAGDTVIASIMAFIAAGASFEEACTIANYAASVVVEDVSIIPIKADELYLRLKESGVIVK